MKTLIRPVRQTPDPAPARPDATRCGTQPDVLPLATGYAGHAPDAVSGRRAAWPDRFRRAGRWLARVYALDPAADARRQVAHRFNAALLGTCVFAGNVLMSVCLVALDCHRNEQWLLACRFPGRLAPDLLTDGQMHVLLSGFAAVWLPATALEVAACAWRCRRQPAGLALPCLRRQVWVLLALNVLIVWGGAHHP